MDGVGEWTTTSVAIGRRRHHQHRAGDPFPAFARPALFRLHLLHRLQGQFRRIQGHGARAIWRAAVRQDDPRRADRRSRGRLFRARSRLFRLLHRSDHDQRAVRCAVRRAAAKAGTAADQRQMDIAASIQAVTEDVVSRLTSISHASPDSEISVSPAAWRSTAWPTASPARGSFDNIWIQPAAGDAGGALGAALAASYPSQAQPRRSPRPDGMKGRYLGPEYEAPDIETPSPRRARNSTSVDDEDTLSETARGTSRWQGGRLVPGPNGVRTAGTRQPLDPGRSAFAHDAEAPQPQGQVP